MIHCGLVMVKSRVTLAKFVSIPSLEMAAAALSIKVSVMLRKALTIHSKIKEYFWTDGQVVPNYINNISTAFEICLGTRQLLKLLKREICIFSNVCQQIIPKVKLS